ncbi:MAG TPA: hypothetical protein VJK52_04595 [Candidatus Nanoarchaeia archaeon]|nr:hypothetical protein [Candidatus Nanoarchaeia archaeon]
MEYTDLLLPIGMGLLFAAVHYFSTIMYTTASAWAPHIRSALSGVSVSYLFLQFYPQSILAGEAAGYDLATIFLWIGIGLAVMLLLENFHQKPLEIFRFTIIQLSIGIVLMVLFSFNTLQGWLFLAWTVLLSAITGISLGALGATKVIRSILAAATLVGILAVVLLPIPVAWVLLLQAAMTGAFTAIVLRMIFTHFQPIFFLAGLLIAGAVISVL